tara:strand:+ start:1187 stop:1432 length:246 start_codon:yes stop_codon:yes gene_type:complete
MKIKMRLQGTEEEVAFLKNYLLKKHPGLCLGSPREGTNPKYDGDQKWSSYGDIEFESTAQTRAFPNTTTGTLKEKKRRRRK